MGVLGLVLLWLAAEWRAGSLQGLPEDEHDYRVDIGSFLDSLDLDKALASGLDAKLHLLNVSYSPDHPGPGPGPGTLVNFTLQVPTGSTRVHPFGMPNTPPFICSLRDSCPDIEQIQEIVHDWHTTLLRIPLDSLISVQMTVVNLTAVPDLSSYLNLHFNLDFSLFGSIFYFKLLTWREDCTGKPILFTLSPRLIKLTAGYQTPLAQYQVRVESLESTSDLRFPGDDGLGQFVKRDFVSATVDRVTSALTDLVQSVVETKFITYSSRLCSFLGNLGTSN